VGGDAKPEVFGGRGRGDAAQVPARRVNLDREAVNGEVSGRWRAHG
jgi:hypothetical protein